MLKKFLPQSTFAKNVFALSAGSFAAQIINFLFTIVLTRFYTPADFGALSLILSIVSFFLVFSNGKYDIAIVVADEESDSKGLLWLSLFLTSIFSIISVIIYVGFYLLNYKFLSEIKYFEWFWSIPVFLFCLSCTQALSMWMVRAKEFKKLSIIKIIESVNLNVVSLVLQKYQLLGLLLGNLSGQIATFFQLAYLSKASLKKYHSNVTWLFLRNLAVKYVQFPRLNILQGFVDMFQVSGIVLIGSYLFDSTVIGYYSLTMRILLIPLGLVVRPIAQVFFSEAAELYRNKGDLYSLTKRTIAKTGMFSLPILIGSLLMGPFLFEFVFGSIWREAGVYAQILSLWVFVDLIRAPINQITLIVGKQRTLLIYSIITSILLLLILIIGSEFNIGMRQTLLWVSIVQTICSVFLIFLLLKIARLSRPQFTV